MSQKGGKRMGRVVPLTIRKEEIDELIFILDETIKEIEDVVC
jgi:hypothetical protein